MLPGHSVQRWASSLGGCLLRGAPSGGAFCLKADRSLRWQQQLTGTPISKAAWLWGRSLQEKHPGFYDLVVRGG